MPYRECELKKSVLMLSLHGSYDVHGIPRKAAGYPSTAVTQKPCKPGIRHAIVLKKENAPIAPLTTFFVTFHALRNGDSGTFGAGGGDGIAVLLVMRSKLRSWESSPPFIPATIWPLGIMEWRKSTELSPRPPMEV